MWGLLSYTLAGGVQGFLFSLFGLAVGTAVLFIPFMLGGMGGGDVKLMGAVGALAGASFVVPAALLTALCGGIMAVAYLLFKGRLLDVMKKILGLIALPAINAIYTRFDCTWLVRLSNWFTPPRQSDKPPLYLPYGVAIALGSACALLNPGIVMRFL